ncbi:stigma-specific STIG1-like protein 1 [Actinidia eriantha]|uniref:stigma-specific STIG1-like protein 1 n=1 Tax=Actinidia eriantha TaxID=165200 RepID=UPI002587B7C7|nr:stigma-specific STIG1-like protein 1 [Actinidia eriantha]
MEFPNLVFIVLLATFVLILSSDITEAGSPRGLSRSLAQSLTANYTCNKYPRVCHLKGSSGQDCCKKKCVNVKIDKLNCGMCGYKCKYPEVCCGGKCVNALLDKRHCGDCHKKCKKGERCVFGMCNYA